MDLHQINGVAVLAAVLMLALPSSATAQQIYRCPDPSGSLRFQDSPCEGGQRMPGSEDGRAVDELALRDWLDSLRGGPPPVPAEPAVRSDAAVGSERSLRIEVGQPGGVSQTELAICSEQMLLCARGGMAAMEACILALPDCQPGGLPGCCPRACVERFAAWREAGADLGSAVRLALLDPEAPACGRP